MAKPQSNGTFINMNRSGQEQPPTEKAFFSVCEHYGFVKAADGVNYSDRICNGRRYVAIMFKKSDRYEVYIVNPNVTAGKSDKSEQIAKGTIIAGTKEEDVRNIVSETFDRAISSSRLRECYRREKINKIRIQLLLKERSKTKKV